MYEIVDEFLPMAVSAFMLAAAISSIWIASTISGVKKQVVKYVDAYISSEYCQCPCHDEDEDETSESWN